jgi:hypothetical protein
VKTDGFWYISCSTPLQIEHARTPSTMLTLLIIPLP